MTMTTTNTFSQSLNNLMAIAHLHSSAFDQDIRMGDEHVQVDCLDLYSGSQGAMRA